VHMALILRSNGNSYSTSLGVFLGERTHIHTQADYAHVVKLSRRFAEGINEALKDVYLNGSDTHRYPGNLNYSFAYVEVTSSFDLKFDFSVVNNKLCDHRVNLC